MYTAADSRSSARVHIEPARALRILIVEDSAEDADIVELVLTQFGYDVSARRVVVLPN